MFHEKGLNWLIFDTRCLTNSTIEDEIFIRKILTYNYHAKIEAKTHKTKY